MAKSKDPKYSVGYKKPPHHTQFKPGQSGNPKGRPKKDDTVADIIRRAIRTPVPIIKDGKRLKISILEAMVMQQLTKAASGDAKAAALIFNELKFHQPEGGDNLSALVQEFRSINSRHKAANSDQTSTRKSKEESGDDK
jgi:hypothetical protein